MRNRRKIYILSKWVTFFCNLTFNCRYQVAVSRYNYVRFFQNIYERRGWKIDSAKWERFLSYAVTLRTSPTFHTFLFFVTLRHVCIFTIPPALRLAIRIDKISRSFRRCFALCILILKCLVCIKFSRQVILRPRNSHHRICVLFVSFS